MRTRMLICAAALVAGALAMVIWQGARAPSPEREVRHYLSLAHHTSVREAGKLAAHFGPEHLPFVIAALTNRNSAFRERLLSLEHKLANHLPDRASEWMISVTDRSRSPDSAFAALQCIANKPDGLEALAPYLRHPDQLIRHHTIWTLGRFAGDGNRRSLALLTDAISHESDPVLHVLFAGYVFENDRNNTNALNVLRTALTGTNVAAANIARLTLKELAVPR